VAEPAVNVTLISPSPVVGSYRYFELILAAISIARVLRQIDAQLGDLPLACPTSRSAAP